ncbi:hypothetical protein C8F01DRAFT_1163809, partial [Mycena amicta]
VAPFIYHTVIAFLALVALAFLARLPRAIARLSRASLWTRGLLLWYAPYAGPPVHWQEPEVSYGYGYVSKNVGGSDSSHDMAPRTPPDSATAPPRIEPTPEFLRPVVSVFRSRLAPGFSAAQFCVCAAWFSIILYAAIYRSPGPFTDQNRFGYIAASQVPFKLNFLHRFVGRVAVLAAHFHGLGYIIQWCLADTFMEQIRQPKNAFGLCMLLSFDGLFLLSTAYVRKNAYNLFIFSPHPLPPSSIDLRAFYHYPPVLPYIYCALRFPHINTGWRAGQHVRIQVFSSALGVTGWAEVHPFTIASAKRTVTEGLVLLCKNVGIPGIRRQVKVIVQGPYGGPGFCIGITFALSAIQELLQQDLKGQSRIRVIELIWVVQTPESMTALLPQLSAMMQRGTSTQLAITVHYTKAVEGGVRGLNNSVHPRLSLKAGRPRFINAIESTLSHAINSSSGGDERHGMIVGVCGPVALADDVVKCVGLVDPLRRDEIGGIEVHEEAFGW